MEKIRCWFFWLKVEWFNSSFWATYLCTPAKLSLLCTPFDTVMLVNKISRFHVKFFDCIATGEERIRDTFPDPIYRTPIRESFSFSTNSKNECSIVRYISLKIQNRRGISHVHLPNPHFVPMPVTSNRIYQSYRWTKRCIVCSPPPPSPWKVLFSL